MNTIAADSALLAMGQLIMLVFLIYGAILSFSVWRLRTPCGLDEGRPSSESVWSTHALLRVMGGLPAPKRFAYVQSAMLLLFLGVVGAPQPVQANGAFERGIEAFQSSDDPTAMTHFQLAAVSGDVRAQEILGFMYLHGPGMFGPGTPQNRDQALFWFGKAAQGGRDVAQYMVCVLHGRAAGAAKEHASCVGNTIAASRAARP